jgi:Fe-S oxidoreductase
VEVLEEGLLLWIGCTSSYRVPELARAFVFILKALGVDYKYLGRDEGCCGSILLRLGLKKEFSKVAEETTGRILSTGAEALVTHCPGCMRTFKLDYLRELKDLGVEVRHSTEVILEHVKPSSLKPLELKALYFDPCHLGRHLKVYEPPRHLLSMVPSLKVIEPEESREESLCCGAGGGVRGCFEELAQAVARELLDYFKSLSAEAVVTACPFCYYNLKTASNGSVKVLDILQVIKASMEGRARGELA